MTPDSAEVVSEEIKEAAILAAAFSLIDTVGSSPKYQAREAIKAYEAKLAELRTKSGSR